MERLYEDYFERLKKEIKNTRIYMIEKTLSKILMNYKIHIQMGKQFYSQQEVDNIKKLIGVCEDFLSNGNKVNVTWLEENHDVLCKAVKCSFVNYRDSFDGEESQTLKNFVIFYKKFYVRWERGFDSIIF